MSLQSVVVGSGGRQRWQAEIAGRGPESMSLDVVFGEPPPAAAAPGPPPVPSDRAIMARSPHENFPAALRLLPGGVRDDLLAVYGFARLADELGDSHAGDRLAALDWLDAELTRAVEG